MTETIVPLCLLFVLTVKGSSMTYFVLAHKRDRTGLSCYGVMENVKMGGYKNKEAAYKRWKKYATSEIKIYTAQGIETVAIRINGKEYLQ